MWLPVAFVIASSSAIATAAAPKSPHHVAKKAQSVRSIGSRASAPASRPSLRKRELTVCQPSSSQMSLAEIVVSQPQRKFSWSGDASSANAAHCPPQQWRGPPHVLPCRGC